MRDLAGEHAERFAALTAVMPAPPRDDPEPARYAFGLRCLLDGGEAAAARRGATP